MIQLHMTWEYWLFDHMKLTPPSQWFVHWDTKALTTLANNIPLQTQTPTPTISAYRNKDVWFYHLVLKIFHYHFHYQFEKARQITKSLWWYRHCRANVCHCHFHFENPSYKHVPYPKSRKVTQMVKVQISILRSKFKCKHTRSISRN